MRNLFTIIIILGVGYFLFNESGFENRVYNGATASDSAVTEAFESRRSDVLVEGNGEVIRILPDDVDGSRHQRFILRLDSGQTLLIAHNIDLAPRINQLKEGDSVAFFGEYIWNDQGGLIHWTHRDPQGRHVAGWLKHEGSTYQ